MNTITCPYALDIRGTLHCLKLREQSAKWDFCIHQHFCQKTGKGTLDADARQCKLRNNVPKGDD